MRSLRHSINVTQDECCDHRAIIPDGELHRHAAKNLGQAVRRNDGCREHEHVYPTVAMRGRQFVPSIVGCRVIY